jgi:thiol:disulfide interchange protein
MRRVAPLAVLLVLLVAVPVLAIEFSTVDWFEGADGFERAVEEAQRFQKPLFVYFRTDWCGYCKQFERNLLSDQTVIDHMDDVIKVTINPESGTAENQIAMAYQVRGYPAIFMHPPVLEQPRAVRRTKMRDGRVGLQSPGEFVETLTRAAMN